MRLKRKQKKTPCKTSFELLAPEAQRVVVTGDFKSWDEDGIPLQRDESGLWGAVVELNPGRYEYKFIVDDEWRTDPDNKNTTQNSYGTPNSVLEVPTG